MTRLVPSLRDLRGTPEGQAARKAISGSTLATLRAFIDPPLGPGFINARVRRRFGPEMRRWAMRYIHWRDATLPRQERRNVHQKRKDLTPEECRGSSPEPTERMIRAEAKKVSASIRQARLLLAKAAITLSRDPYSQHLLAQLGWPPEEPTTARLGRIKSISAASGEVAYGAILELERHGAWRDELDRIDTTLARLFQRANAVAIAEPSKRGGPNERVLHRQAIAHLALLWHEMVGELPGSRNDTEARAKSPFYGFVGKALETIWPGAPEASALIGQVCTQLRKRKPKLET